MEITSPVDLINKHIEGIYYKKLFHTINSKKTTNFLKRISDFCIALIILLIVFPILFLIAIAIKGTSKGPVIYSDYRMGLGGKYFKCYKFRSMVNNQPIKKDDHINAIKYQEKGLLFKTNNDSRVTKIGKFIRKSSLDELPQLLNVILGDMSLVGPRPLLPFLLEPYPKFKQIRGLLRPGMTGLWQVRDRVNNTSAVYMVKHDIEYVVNYSFFLDLKILLKTPIVVFSGKGAF